MLDEARNMPFTLRIATPANALTPNETWGNPFPVLGISTLALDWAWKDPTSSVLQWSFTIQRALTKDMSLEVGYAGSAGLHLYRTTAFNEQQPVPPTANLNVRRPFPSFGGVIYYDEGASHSSYDALQVRLQQRFSHGFTILSSASYEKSIDNGSGVRQAKRDEHTPQNVYSLAGERGLSVFNFGYRWINSFLYELPVGKGKAILGNANALVQGVLGGWQVGGIVTWQGGFPLSAYCSSGSTYQNTDAPCRADATGISPTLSSPTPNDWFNIGAFVNRLNFTPGVGPYTFGNSGRNVIIGPGIVEIDASLQKSFTITERTHVDSVRSSSIFRITRFWVNREQRWERRLMR